MKIGNGDSINFWSDNWLGYKVSDFLKISNMDVLFLTSMEVDLFIMVNGSFLTILSSDTPLLLLILKVLLSLLSIVLIILSRMLLLLVLTFKKAYSSQVSLQYIVSWEKLILTLLSPCKIVGVLENHSKWKAQHLFFECSFARHLWTWLEVVLDCKAKLTSPLAMLGTCSMDWGSRANDVVFSLIVNIFFLEYLVL